MNESLAPPGWTRKLLRAPHSLLSLLGMLAIVSMLLNIVLDVTMRNVAHAPIQGTLEYTTYWYMVTISFVGMWLAQGRREHISVTLVTDRLNAQAKALMSVVSAIVSVVFLAGLTWYGLEAALEYATIQEYTGATRVPIWPFRFLVPICMAALLVSILLTTREDVKALLSNTHPNSSRQESI